MHLLPDPEFRIYIVDYIYNDNIIMDPSQFSSDAPGSLHFDPDGYWTFHPFPLPPLFRWSDRLVMTLSAADWALARMSALVIRAPDGFGGLMARIEAAASCRLSGQRTDLEALCAHEAAYRSETAAPDGHEAAARYAAELERVCRNAAVGAPALQEIAAIHGRLLPGPDDLRGPVGVFRRGQTWIGPPGSGPAEAVFVPPPPEAMTNALESLAGFMRSGTTLPPLVRLAMVHYQFTVIHPFYDANGRLGRLLNSLLLCRWGLLPGPLLALSPFLERRAGVYPELLGRVSRENAVEEWLNFFLGGIVEQAVETERVLEALESMRADYFSRLISERAADRLEHVIDLFLAAPLMNISQVDIALTEGNFKSAARAVDRLVELNLLEETTGQARHRVFRAGEWLGKLLEILGDQIPEGDLDRRKERKARQGRKLTAR